MLETTKREKTTFNWSYNLNKDIFWSNMNMNNRDEDKKNKSVPSTPTVALPPSLYKQKRGLGSLGKQSSGRFVFVKSQYLILNSRKRSSA